jgi:hypothetical protein
MHPKYERILRCRVISFVEIDRRFRDAVSIITLRPDYGGKKYL